MSFIVKGAEMPKMCWDCPLSDVEQGWCDRDLVTIIDFNELPVECPLGALPEKHGRLVDADATASKIEIFFAREIKRLGFVGYSQADRETQLYLDGIINALAIVMDAQTIVEAEGE